MGGNPLPLGGSFSVKRCEKGREEMVEVVVHLQKKVIGGKAELVGNMVVELVDGARVVVGLEQEPVRGAGAEAVCIVEKSEGDVESATQEGLHLLGLAAETVEDPGLGGLLPAVDLQEGVEGFDAMDDEGLAQLLAQPDLLQEGGLLDVHGRTTKGIETAFADGEDGVEVGKGCGDVGLPGVDAPSVDALGECQRCAEGIGLVGMEIDRYHGTGSYPCPPQGWQRRRRRMAR